MVIAIIEFEDTDGLVVDLVWGGGVPLLAVSEFQNGDLSLLKDVGQGTTTRGWK